jgi:hypothetical protein
LPKLFLHIGAHKTGTTAIQLFARSNQNRLKEQGLWYPDYRPISDRGADAHHDFAHTIAGDSRLFDLSSLKELVRYWSNTASSSRDALMLSAEPFWRHTISIDGNKNWFKGRRLLFARLADLLSSFDVTVIVVLRRQDDYIRSLYQELVMKNANLGQLRFNEFRKRFFEIRKESKAKDLLTEFLKTVCYNDNLAIIDELFCHLQVITYEELNYSNDFCVAFFECLGISTEGFETVDLVRQSWAPEVSELKRLLNERLTDNDLNKRINKWILSDRVQRLFEKHLSGRHYDLWEDLRARQCFIESFTEENEQIRMKYFPDRNYLFPPFVDTGNACKMPMLTHEFLADLLITHF